MSGPRAIVFDLDDTLYSERDYAFSGFHAVAVAFQDKLGSVDESFARMRAMFDTPDRSRIFNVLTEERSLLNTDNLVDAMVTAYRSHTPSIKLHADADAALARLRPGCKLGLITDGHSVAQHAKIEALALRELLDAVIVTDDWGREFWKPHPRAFQEMSRILDVRAESCTYVADNSAKDFLAPNALGWQTVLVRRPEGLHRDNPPAEGGAPHRTITTLDALR